MAQPASFPSYGATFELDSLMALVTELVRPVVQRNVAAGAAASTAATTMVAEARRVLELFPELRVDFSAEDEQAAVASLAEKISDAAVQAAPAVFEHHVREAADVVITTWVDVLDQGIAEHGVLDLHPEYVIPTEKQYPKLSEILEESLLPTVLSNEDARQVMHALAGYLFERGSRIALPLGIVLERLNGSVRASRAAS